MSFARQGSFDEDNEVSQRTSDVPTAGDVTADGEQVVSTPWFSAADAAGADEAGTAASFDPTNTFDTEYDEALPLEQFPITGFIATLGDDAADSGDAGDSD